MESAVQSIKKMSGTRSERPARRTHNTRPKVNMALDRSEVSRMIGRIREEVEFHRGCAGDLKAKLEKLTSRAFEEILKVKELKNIIETLRENGDHGDDALSAPAGAGKKVVPYSSKKERKRWRALGCWSAVGGWW